MCKCCPARSPKLINDQPVLLADSFIIPEEALCSVPEPLCNGTHPPNGAVIQGASR